MMTFILFLVLSAADIPYQNELKQTVSAYWTLMSKGQKAEAMKYVLESSKNDFVTRVEPKVKGWQYVGAELAGETEAVVTVEINALLPGASPAVGFQKITKRERWIRESKAWKLKVEKPSIASAMAPVFSGGKQPEPLPNALQLSPLVLKIQFLNRLQQGRLQIVNGTGLPADLLLAKVDETRFNLVQRPDRVQPGQAAEVVVEYKGTENDKNLESQITVLLKQGDQEKLFQVPILYNYLSEGARGLFGLTEEQARQLKRGDKVSPVLNQPKSPVRPPSPPQP